MHACEMKRSVCRTVINLDKGITNVKKHVKEEEIFMDVKKRLKCKISKAINSLKAFYHHKVLKIRS